MSKSPQFKFISSTSRKIRLDRIVEEDEAQAKSGLGHGEIPKKLSSGASMPRAGDFVSSDCSGM